jgi:integrase
VVVIPETAVRMLREHKRRQNAERLEAGDRFRDHGLMFTMPDGDPPNYRGIVLSHFKPILRKAELPRTFSPYSCRHTADTMLLGMGEHPKIVAERLGHSSTQQTMDTYSHVLPDMQEASALKLQEVLYG